MGDESHSSLNMFKKGDVQGIRMWFEVQPTDGRLLLYTGSKHSNDQQYQKDRNSPTCLDFRQVRQIDGLL